MIANTGCQSGPSEDSEEALRDAVSKFYSVWGGNPSFTEAVKYSPGECPLNPAELKLNMGLASAFLAVEPEEVDIRVGEVEFIATDRALVKVRLLAGGEGVFGTSGVRDEGELWVLQGGRWRNASDCDALQSSSRDVRSQLSQTDRV